MPITIKQEKVVHSVKLFEPDLKSTSYKIPIIKVVTSLLIITACMFRGSIFHVENKLLIFIFSFAAVALVISCVLIVYISCCEIFATFENTHESVIAKGTYNLMHIDDVLSQIESNDIIEYQILADDRAILIGASSDNRYGSDKFFDKKYYCDKQEFDTIDELSNALSKYLFDDCLQVMAIDGIKVK